MAVMTRYFTQTAAFGAKCVKFTKVRLILSPTLLVTDKHRLVKILGDEPEQGINGYILGLNTVSTRTAI